MPVTDKMRELSEAIRSTLEDIDSNRLVDVPGEPELGLSLISQCEELLGDSTASSPPLRVINHFACTGGTLICKCLAALPNAYLVSEIEPNSRIQVSPERPRFSPTDLIYHLRNSLREVPEEVIESIFVTGIEKLHAWTSSVGADLILRGHAHSVYCFDSEPIKPLATILDRLFSLRSIITVRNPIDSYISSVERGWISNEANSLDDYSGQYLRFINENHNSNIYKYEEFVENPKEELAKICDDLKLEFDESALFHFHAFHLTGDSGRSGGLISKREQKRRSPDLVNAIKASDKLRELCKILDYEVG